MRINIILRSFLLALPTFVARLEEHLLEDDVLFVNFQMNIKKLAKGESNFPSFGQRSHIGTDHYRLFGFFVNT